MSTRVFLAVLLFSCSVINSSTISLSTGANFLALLLNLMGLVVLMDYASQMAQNMSRDHYVE
jgi:hypothetical protein